MFLNPSFHHLEILSDKKKKKKKIQLPHRESYSRKGNYLGNLGRPDEYMCKNHEDLQAHRKTVINFLHTKHSPSTFPVKKSNGAWRGEREQ